MKIMHIIPYLGGGGAEILLGSIAIEQVNRGCKVIVVILEPVHFTYINYPLKQELESKVTIYKIATRVRFSFLKNTIAEKYDEFENIIKEFKPDIIHSHLFSSELVSRFRISASVRYFTHCHDNMHQFSFFTKKPLRRRFTDYLEKKWIIEKYKACNNTFIAISNHTQNYFIQNLPSSLKNRVCLLPNAINTSLFFSNPEKENLVNGIYRLVSVGNLVEKKGHSFLIDVMSILVNDGVKVHLDVLGFGELQEELQLKINQLFLSQHITLHGNVSNVNEFMSKAHIYLHAAIYEPFGLVLLEAMASGLPVVCTDGKGNKDLITEGYNGFLLTERNPEKYAQKVKYLVEEGQIRKEIGENALKFSKKYNIEAYTEKLFQLYHQS